MKNWEDMPVIMTVKQLSALLHYSPKTIREFCIRGLIPHKKLGRQYRFNRERVRKWSEKDG